MANILHVQSGDWKEIESGGRPALVDFWAEWCGPCHRLSPTFERLAEKYGSDIQFAKLNVDELPDVAARWGVRSIPTLLLLKSGNEIERLVGVKSYEEIAGVLERHLAVPVPK
ncbi:MAG: thioredoxin [Terriglobia bacterium]